MRKQIKQQNKKYICQKWPQQDYLIQNTIWLSWGLKTSNGKTVLASYTTSNLTLKSGKLLITVVGNMRLNWVDSVLDTYPIKIGDNMKLNEVGIVFD